MHYCQQAPGILLQNVYALPFCQLLTLIVLLADPYPLYNYLVKELNKFNLLYVHMVEPRIGKQMNVIEVDESDKSLKPFKKLSNAAFIAAGGWALFHLLLPLLLCPDLASASPSA